MGCCLSTPRTPAPVRQDKPVLGAAVVTATPVATTTLLSDMPPPPHAPSDDSRNEFEWAKSAFLGDAVLGLQRSGFVIASEVANGYVLLRRPRVDLSAHWFASASHAKLRDRIVPLGARRIGPSFVTRDVPDHTSDAASITMCVAPSGIETYVFRGATVNVSFPPGGACSP
jgi:hypothetical protein